MSTIVLLPFLPGVIEGLDLLLEMLPFLFFLLSPWWREARQVWDSGLVSYGSPQRDYATHKKRFHTTIEQDSNSLSDPEPEEKEVPEQFHRFFLKAGDYQYLLSKALTALDLEESPEEEKLDISDTKV